jgi:hypothetical protein
MGTRATDVESVGLVSHFLGLRETATGVYDGPIKQTIDSAAVQLAAHPAFSDPSVQRVYVDTRAELDADLHHDAGTLGVVLADQIGTTVSRARSANTVTLVLAAPHGKVSGQDVNIEGVGGTGYNGHVVLTSGTAGSTLKYVAVGGDESTTADTGGNANNNGYYIKQDTFDVGSWTWSTNQQYGEAIDIANAASIAAEDATTLASAADQRALQGAARRAILHPWLSAEISADGYAFNRLRYDGWQEFDYAIRREKFSAHPSLIWVEVTADGYLKQTLSDSGDLVDYFQRRYIDDFLESERFGWFGVLSAGTILVASGFPYELSVTLTWPSDGADISMTMAENDQLITWVDAV